MISSRGWRIPHKRVEVKGLVVVEIDHLQFDEDSSKETSELTNTAGSDADAGFVTHSMNGLWLQRLDSLACIASAWQSAPKKRNTTQQMQDRCCTCQRLVWVTA